MAKDFTELVCWQLARELSTFMMKVTSRPTVRRHRKFCEQADDAAASAPRNMAEGFGRYDHKEFAHFVKIALGSLHETRNHVIEAFDRGFITEVERRHGLELTRRAIGAAIRLRSYLLTSTAPEPSFKPDGESPTEPPS
jgi:four helix bundle protein